MTSTHCTDCPYFDKDHPADCCSNSIRPKPQVCQEAQHYEDEEFSRLIKMRGYGAFVIGDL